MPTALQPSTVLRAVFGSNAVHRAPHHSERLVHEEEEEAEEWQPRPPFGYEYRGERRQ